MPAEDFVATSPAELSTRIDAAYERFVALFDRPSAERPIRSAWTARDVLAHLVNVVNRYTDFKPNRLADEPRGVATINDHEIATLADRTPAQLLRLLADEMVVFRSKWGPDAGISLGMPVPFHGGGSIDVQSVLTNLIGEYLLHGLDVAAEQGVPWPIDDRDAQLLCAFGTQLLPAYVRASHKARLSVRFDLDGVAPWLLDIDGAVGISRRALDDDAADVHLRGPAAPVVLLFYARLDIASALGTGLAIVGGTNPQRVSELDDLFERP